MGLRDKLFEDVMVDKEEAVIVSPVIVKSPSLPRVKRVTPDAEAERISPEFNWFMIKEAFPPIPPVTERGAGVLVPVPIYTPVSESEVKTMFPVPLGVKDKLSFDSVPIVAADPAPRFKVVEDIPKVAEEVNVVKPEAVIVVSFAAIVNVLDEESSVNPWELPEERVTAPAPVYDCPEAMDTPPVSVVIESAFNMSWMSTLPPALITRVVPSDVMVSPFTARVPDTDALSSNTTAPTPPADSVRFSLSADVMSVDTLEKRRVPVIVSPDSLTYGSVVPPTVILLNDPVPEQVMFPVSPDIVQPVAVDPPRMFTDPALSAPIPISIVVAAPAKSI